MSTAISETPLVEAVLQNDVAQVTALLRSGADANTQSTDGQTALYLAAEQGRVEIAKLLLDHGADVNRVSPTSIESPYLQIPVPGSGLPASLPTDRKSIRQMASDTPLVIAAWRGHADVVGLLIAHGAKTGFRSAFGWSPLLAAAKNGHRDVALVLLEHGADIEAPNSRGEAALHVAISFNRPDLVRVLMDKGANVNSRNRAGETPLMAALMGLVRGRQEQLDVVNWLLAAGADVNAAPPTGVPPLAWAARNGNRDLVEAIMKRGVTAEAKAMALDDAIQFGKIAVIETLIDHGAGIAGPLSGMRLLANAVGNNQIEVARVLLEHGVDVNAHDEATGTALSYAALRGNLAFVNFLLEHGADPNIVRKGQPSPLVNAVDQGRLDIVTALLDRGADVNGGQGATRTPLLVAIQKGHGRIAETLLDHGAPVNGRGDENLLFAAVWANQSDMAKLLLERGADVTIKPGQRDTYFHLAARQGKVAVVKALLDHGANPNITTDHGRTPLHDVASTSHLDVATLLLSKGAAVNAEDSDGRTPLHWASNRGST
ncbi:MAG TPA: ankyrin repeat domain-containing protein, partial [Nitrospiria bacterium]|nr:ankyrin repeat domain-containing protein [Nitrospiria bacterium]